jgi:hypothetical protein
MKTNWQHQKDAITTDQKLRDDDEHTHELDKRHLKKSREDAESIPGRTNGRNTKDSEVGED